MLDAIRCACCRKGIPGWVVRAIDSTEAPVVDKSFHSFFDLFLYGDYMTSKCAERILARASNKTISSNVDKLRFWMLARHDKQQYLQSLVSRCG